MTTATAPSMTPREHLADHLLSAILEHAVTARPEMDGTEVVTVEVINELFQRKHWPHVTDQAADVRTPAKIVVTAVCPACHQTAAITMTVNPELRVESSSSTLRLHAKAKPGSHTCGQVSAELGNGQTEAFDMADLVDEEGVVQAEVLRDLLELVGETVSLETVEGWTEPQREEVRAWAAAVHLNASDHDDIEVPPRPKPLWDADSEDVVDPDDGEEPKPE